MNTITYNDLLKSHYKKQLNEKHGSSKIKQNKYFGGNNMIVKNYSDWAEELFERIGYDEFLKYDIKTLNSMYLSDVMG